ncbi:hypothetical protein BURPSPAST_N0007 [Burkholderia pseudomallei Pasteur 52237]|nr:hypothetical protein BURPSPAST_N0007 [Burkholderia pseudomallei Pasteur 52237]
MVSPERLPRDWIKARQNEEALYNPGPLEVEKNEGSSKGIIRTSLPISDDLRSSALPFPFSIIKHQIRPTAYSLHNNNIERSKSEILWLLTTTQIHTHLVVHY